MSKKREKQTTGSRDGEYVVVYSTEPAPPPRCPACRRLKSECVCPPAELSKTALKPAFRLERKGRGGKTVTIVHKLPDDEALLADLCGFLKKSIGSGGTYYKADGEGFVEVQGDRRDDLPALIERYKRK